MHAEILIGNASILLADDSRNMGRFSTGAGGIAGEDNLYLDEVDDFAKHAVTEGAKLIRPLQIHFYGHRAGQLTDPFGYTWMISTRIETCRRKKFSDALTK